ncbi:MAG: OmpH family outer membrane protein [Rhodobacterales bacterium]|nr:OmpH family outer membrane protein [Rhodobacterales bacterium]
MCITLGLAAFPIQLSGQSAPQVEETQSNQGSSDVSRRVEGPFIGTPVAANAILVVSLEELYARSDFGLRVAAQFSQSGGALASENRQIETELVAEEKALADQRPDMDPVEFRALADAFDVKVQKFRARQDAKVRALGQESDRAKNRFFEFVLPVLDAIMRERGAVVVFERESAILSISTIDVTAEAIAKINAVSFSIDPAAGGIGPAQE